MTGKKFDFSKILIIAILLTSYISSATQLIVNGDFSSNSCSSITQNYAGCQGTDLLTGWSAKKIADSSSSPLSVQNRTLFTHFPTNVQNIVPLDYLDSAPDPNGRQYKRICIQQTLSSELTQGTYHLTFQAATRSNDTGTSYTFYDYKVGIKNSENSAGALTDINLAWTSYGLATISSIFTTASTYENQLFYICSRPTIFNSVSYNENSLSRATGVSQISLIKVPEVDITAEKDLNVNLVQNGDFEYNDCLNQMNSGYGCQGATKLLYWSANFIRDSSSAPVSVQTPALFKDVTDKYVVPLDVNDNSYNSAKPYRRTCIKQNLGLLIPGNYKLDFNSATRNNQSDTAYVGSYMFSTSIKSDDSSSSSLSKVSYTISAFSLVARTQHFTVNVRKQNQYLYFCSEAGAQLYYQTSNPRGMGISNVRLINEGCDSESTVTVPFNTGYDGCIPTSVFDSLGCDIYKYNDSTNQTSCATVVFPATTQCINEGKMKLDTEKYACPIQNNPTFYDANCEQYTSLGSYKYQCNSCKKDYYLKSVFIQDQVYKKCLQSLIPDCTVYTSDGVCSQCVQELSYNTYFNVCPTQAHKLISDCKAAILGPTSVGCIVCGLNYIISPMGTCLSQVQYCQLYADAGKKQCIKCIPGFYLSNNICYKVQGNCEMFDPKTNTCNKCLTGFTLKNNDCVAPLTPCLESQYRNSYGVCVNGDTPNCGFYDSVTGICQYCKEGYKFNDYWNCVQAITVTCPPDTADYSYVIELGQCKKVEKGCAYNGPDGCLACKQGHYLYNKQCLKVSVYQGLTTQNIVQQNGQF